MGSFTICEHGQNSNAMLFCAKGFLPEDVTIYKWSSLLIFEYSTFVLLCELATISGTVRMYCKRNLLSRIGMDVLRKLNIIQYISQSFLSASQVLEVVGFPIFA